MKYKLIKKYPGSVPVGTVVEKHYPNPGKPHFCYKGTYQSGVSTVHFSNVRDQVEGFEEFWQPLNKEWVISNRSLKLVYEGGSYVTLHYDNGNRVKIAFSTIQLLVNDPFKVDKVADFDLNRIYMHEVIEPDSTEPSSFIIPIGEYHVEDFVEGYLIGCQYISYKFVKEIYEWIK